MPAIIISIATGLACFYFRQILYPGPGDFNWALEFARALLNGTDPYAFTPSALRVPYPLPVAIFGLPVAWLDDKLAAAIFFGSSSGLLAYGIIRHDQPWRLLCFLSFPFFYALMFAQWAPLVMASWFFPALAPVMVLVKPQLALPVALTKYSKHGLVIAASVLALSLAIYPAWPLVWRSMTKDYVYVIPALVMPYGPALLLSLCWLEYPVARLLAIASVMPFRGAYDLLALSLIPQSKAQMIFFVALTWLMPAISLPEAFAAQAPWPVAVLFLPALALVASKMLKGPVWKHYYLP